MWLSAAKRGALAGWCFHMLQYSNTEPASDYPQYAQTGARPQSSGQVIPSWFFVSIPCISRSSPASPSLAAQCYRLLDRITGTSTYGVNVLVRAVARLEREQLAVSMVMGSVKLTVRCDAAERGRGVAANSVSYSYPGWIPCRLIISPRVQRPSSSMMAQ